MKDLSIQEQQTFEELIDRCSLQSVLEHLAIICSEKAEHIVATWQDATLAARWNTVGEELSLTADAAANL